MLFPTSLQHIKKVSVLVLLLFIGLLLITYPIWHNFDIKPIGSSEIYFKDSFRNIYKDTTTGCLDICLFRTFQKLPVDKNTFTVLMVKSPFTRIHAVGEMTESNYAKDDTQVFWRGKPVIGTDSLSFTAVSYDLGKDKIQYFIYDRPLQTYITEETNQASTFTIQSLEVISYLPSEYLILEVNDRNYMKLDLQLKTMEEITLTSAREYPSL